MNRAFLTNHKFRIAEDGWVHLAPVGEFGWGSGEEAITEVIDAEAVRSMVANFAGEMLFDFEHESHSPGGSTRAAGWIQELAARDDGLWGRVKWSAAGEEAVRGGVYRFLSPTFDGDTAVDLPTPGGKPPRKRMTTLLDAALTNLNNLPVQPLSNRGQSADGDEKNQTPKNQTMKLVTNALGLSADASEQSALEAVTKLKNDLRAAQETLAKKEDELTNAKAAHDVTAAKLKNAEEEKAKLEEELKNKTEEEAEAALDEAGIEDAEMRARWKAILLTEGGEALFADFVAALGGGAETVANECEKTKEEETANKKKNRFRPPQTDPKNAATPPLHGAKNKVPNAAPNAVPGGKEATGFDRVVGAFTNKSPLKD